MSGDLLVLPMPVVSGNLFDADWKPDVGGIAIMACNWYAIECD